MVRGWSVALLVLVACDRSCIISGLARVEAAAFGHVGGPMIVCAGDGGPLESIRGGRSGLRSDSSATGGRATTHEYADIRVVPDGYSEAPVRAR